MASRFVSAYSATVTDATRSILTVASTVGLLVGMVGFIVLGGQTTRRIRVVAIPSATTFQAQFYPDPSDDNYERGASAGYPNNASGSDLSAYTGGSGTVSFEAQLAYDPALR